MILQTIKSLRWTDFFIYAITDPRSLYRLINRNDPAHFGMGIFVLLLVSFTDMITTSLLQVQSPFFFYKLSYGWILSFLISVLYVILFATFADMSAQFLKFRGNIREMISLVNFSLVPHLFLLPVLYLFKVFNFAPGFFYILFVITLYIWSLIIMGVGISEMHSSGAGKAILIVLFPIIFLVLFMFLAVILASMLFSGFLTNM